jgi:hypothetical protein
LFPAPAPGSPAFLALFSGFSGSVSPAFASPGHFLEKIKTRGARMNSSNEVRTKINRQE